ncbi:hypothetical protein GCM10025782_08850 [Pedococcus ginsenosidimutans]|uniref:Uncharacterized protein n=1 Tax=Pedococcus ginsenosidimutans TaxID=490570 RepID=A0ABP8XWE4_9MICO
MGAARSNRFRLGPIPNYSATTANGTRVSCAGCCLPLPLGCLASVVALLVPLAAAVMRRRRDR